MKAPLVAALLAGTCFSTSTKGPNGEDPRDVTGNYDVTYDNQLTLKLNIGGAERVVTQSGYGGIADFGVYQGQPVQIDMTAFCARPDVQCPSETFWSKVAINQPDLNANSFDLQTLTVIDNTQHELDAGVKAKSISGLVDHSDADRYILGIGAQGGTQGSCGAFDVSWTNGRFKRAGETVSMVAEYRDALSKPCDPDGGIPGGLDDGGAALPDGGAYVCHEVMVEKIDVPPGAKVDGITDGKVGLFWAGGCAFGPFLVGATFSLETGYTASRTGNYDPPPFTPSVVSLPDGGVDAGIVEVVDAGP
jgi:hypothetical protein